MAQRKCFLLTVLSAAFLLAFETVLLLQRPLSTELGVALAESPAAAISCPPVVYLRPFRQRMDLGAELKRLGLRGIGVELGTLRGDFTRILLSGWRQASLYIQVDLWAPQQNYRDMVGQASLNEHEQFMSIAGGVANGMLQLGYAKAVEQCRNFTTVCAHRFADGSLDFVYVDARHDRKGVLNDLQVYWPKMRVGGVMAGHDYMEQREPDSDLMQAQDPQNTGQDWTLNFDGTRDVSGRVVKGAVDDFFSGIAEESPKDLRNCPRQVVVSYRENQWNTWAVVK